jgi:hypothetical protein
MRWSYKTVLYELKKEGLLGSAFLDESEIEQSLNEFGAAGWELISMIETRDGIMSVFKQPLARLAAHPVEEEEEIEEVLSPNPPPVRERKPVIRPLAEPEEESEPLSGIGSIRIE